MKCSMTCARWIGFVALTLAVALSAAAGEEIYGKGVGSAKIVPIAELLASPANWAGQPIEIEGRITDVCPMAGCWADLDGGTGTVRVKVKDGEIVFPKEAVGKKMRASGVLNKREMTQEQAVAWFEHLAEERGEKFDASTITGPMTIWQLDTTGAVIND